MTNSFKSVDIVVPGPNVQPGAYQLQGALGLKHIPATITKRTHIHSYYYTPDGTASNNTLVVNWGNGGKFKPAKNSVVILNHNTEVENKKVFLTKLCLHNLNLTASASILCPKFFVDYHAAIDFCHHTGCRLVCLDLTQGRNGSGMTIFDPADFHSSFNKDAKLYTEYIEKKEEYRVHIDVNWGVMYLQKKVRLMNPPPNPTEGFPYGIRNSHNGWVWKKIMAYDVPNKIWPAVSALKDMLNGTVDFFAADFLYNESADAFYALEVNLSPGLCPTGASEYSDMIERHFKKGW